MAGCPPRVGALGRVGILIVLGIVAGSALFNLLAYAGASRHRRRHPPPCPADEDERAPWAARAWAFAVECAVTALLALATPLGFRRPRVRPLDGEARPPVVLVHGYAQHPANFLWLARRLRADGWHVYTVGHTPVRGDIERSAHRLAEAIDRIRRASGAAQVDVVAHSMGGLVARACIRARGHASGIGRLVTLGTPHRGTEIFPRFRLDPMVGQMRPGAPLMTRLADDDPVPRLADCISIYSADDAVVVPPGAAYYPGALNIEVRGLGHLSLLFSPRVYALVRENLAAERAPVAAAGGGSWPR
jgi:pimeloyl-ACP methyl ester carboxylesterase